MATGGDQPTGKKPTVRMPEEEAWEFVRRSVNGIFTTLRRDGRPIALPVWFVAFDERIYISTRGKKLDRIRNDPRCSFLVEAGERWAELRAVHMECEAFVLDDIDDGLTRRIAPEMDAKYAPYRTARDQMPAASRQHYEQATGGIVELRVTGKVLTWDNRRLEVS